MQPRGRAEGVKGKYGWTNWQNPAYKGQVDPISRPCTFPLAHWRLLFLIHDFNLVIGGKLHSEYLSFSLLVANYSRNIPFFLHWRPGCRHIGNIATICSLNIPNKSLYNASYYICIKITSQVHIGSYFSLRKWRRWPHFPTKLAAAARIWQHYWRCSDMVWILEVDVTPNGWMTASTSGSKTLLKL